MPIKFSCRECKRTLKASSRLAGRPIECPHCGFKQRVPSPKPPGAAPSSADLAGVPVSKSKDLLDSDPKPSIRPTLSKPQPKPERKPAAVAAPSGPLPFDDAEWDEALNPYEAPKEEDGPKLPSYTDSGPGYAAGSMRWARRGLQCIYFGICLGALAGILGVVLIVVGFLTGSSSLIILSGLLMLAWGGCQLLTLIGPYLCVFVPEESGARSKALAAATAQTIYIAVDILHSVTMFSEEADIADLQGLAMVSQFSRIASYIAFMVFVKAVADYVKRTDLAESASSVLTAGVAGFIFLAVPSICEFLAEEIEGIDWVLWIGSVTGIVAFFTLMSAFFKFLGVIRQLSLALNR